jgi:hypothetical protein
MGGTQLLLKELLPFDLKNFLKMSFQVKFEYGWDPIIIEGVITLGLRKFHENEFPFIFALMVRWIQMIFGIQMYHEEMQVMFEYGWDPIINEGVITL